ncbi:methyl-accepting chemotaxis protein [Halobacterium wangiae]|uniref:methyl-accepting chemotaxis protein n=1 Tax=Halobacterium wangiae TaxID=2902623 RepID=UPI001E4A8779|nr:methyl-accepting chemotaxis protein [Halobacterium wangiae]
MSLRSLASRVARRLTPGFVRRSYLAKFGAALLVVVLCIGAVGAATYVETSDQLNEQSRSEYTTAAELSSASVSEWLDERTNNARMLAQYDVLVGGNYSRIQSFLAEELARMPDDVRNVHYVNFQSRESIASTDPDMRRQRLNADSAPWSTQDISYGDDDVYVSEPYVKDGATRVAFVARIDADFGLRSAVVLTTDLGDVTTNFRQPTANSNTQLVSASGDVLADDRAVAKLEPYAESNNSTVVAAAGSGDSGFLGDGEAARSFDEPHVVSYAPVEGTEWAVALHVPTNEAFALRTTVTTRLLVMVGVALAGLAFIGLTLGRGTVTALNVLGRKADALERGEYDTDLEVGREDEIGGLFASFASLRDTVEERITAAERERESAEQARAEAEDATERAEAAKQESERRAEALRETAASFSASMAAYADGDLTVRLDESVEQDAMADVAASFNEMAAAMEETVAGVVSFADEVAGASDEVSARVESVEHVGQDVASSVDRISDRTAEQRDELESVAVKTDDMSATIEEVAASADEVAETSRTTADLGDDGRDAAADAVDELRDIEAETERTAAAVRELESQMADIESIVDVITDIAEQTNILALNASIEAARAGEAGDGFAVVAEEVKQLAEETKQSAGDIEALVTDVREQTDESVSAMGSIRERVGDGVETVEETHDTLETIVESVEEADTGVQEITRAMDEQASSVADVAGAVDDVVTLGEETAGAAENAADAAEEQANTLAEVTEQARSLSDRAEALRDRVDSFEVDSDTSLDADPGATREPTETRADGFEWQGEQ